MEKPKKAIASYTDAGQLRQIMKNAKKLADLETYWAALDRICELEAVGHQDPLERDFFAMLAAYEELLSDKHGRKRYAARTRRKLTNRGVIGCLEHWALSLTRKEGFWTLVENGLVHRTGEYIVTKYPDRFSTKAVKNAQQILESIKD